MTSQVCILHVGDQTEYPNGIRNNLLSIAFGTSRGCAFVTGLELNLAAEFAKARERLILARQRKAVKRLDRYMWRYTRRRFEWN